MRSDLPDTDTLWEEIFVGGGLAALALLAELGGSPGGRTLVVDPLPPAERPPVHWSYWSRRPTPYDRFALGSWSRARVGRRAPEPLDPYTLRLVLSTDVLTHLAGLLAPAGVRWLRATAREVRLRGDGLYTVATDAGTLSARRVFDSAPEVAPAFPDARGPQAVLSGTGLRVTADREVFDPESATLLDPLDTSSFAYLLPLSSTEALIESASFGPLARGMDKTPLLGYLRARYPGAGFSVGHAEHGVIPLGFAPLRTAGPGHVLLGAKRGLVKPSAGYGVVPIARESERLARLWREGLPLPPARKAPPGWHALDRGFLRLATRDFARPFALVERVMRSVPLPDSLGFIHEDLTPGRLARVARSALPSLLSGPLR